MRRCISDFLVVQGIWNAAEQDKAGSNLTRKEIIERIAGERYAGVPVNGLEGIQASKSRLEIEDALWLKHAVADALDSFPPSPR